MQHCLNLSTISKPARYSGGEYNSIVKNTKQMQCNFALCFADVYEIAESNMGLKILYKVLNDKDNIYAQRCYAPWFDYTDALRANKMPLCSLESKTPLNDFDVVGFSLSYELCYTNVLLMLDLGGIPLLSNKRNDNSPLIIAGGLCAYNPMPLSPFVDVFLIGDGEHTILEVANIVCEYNASGKKGGRQALLQKLNTLECAYVPSIDKNKKVLRAIETNLDAAVYPTAPIVANTEAVFNRASLELFRGCERGCRYCQAGYLYRPHRAKSVDTLVKQAEELIKNCGYDEFSLASLSTCDYAELPLLIEKLQPLVKKHNVTLSLPSTRVDAFETEYAVNARLSSLTFAPEAGSQRLRDVINKKITDEDIFNACKKAFSMGYKAVKLYFMLGLPTETDDDIYGIVQIVKQIRVLYKQTATSKKPLSLSVSCGTFIPKAHTPYAKCALIDFQTHENRQKILKENLKKLGVKFSYSNYKTSTLECAFGRGDTKLAEVILQAYKLGCTFDSWNEHCKYDLWLQAFSDCNVDINDYLKLQTDISYKNINTGKKCY